MRVSRYPCVALPGFIKYTCPAKVNHSLLTGCPTYTAAETSKVLARLLSRNENTIQYILTLIILEINHTIIHPTDRGEDVDAIMRTPFYENAQQTQGLV
jgi:hypothetical protein